MKKTFVILLAIATLLPSCKKNNSDPVTLVEGIVTVKGVNGAECTLQLNDKTVLIPENQTTNPYNKQVRAQVIYNDKGESDRSTADVKYRKVQLYRIDSILTKKPVPNLGKGQNDTIYGTAPLGVYDSWATAVEDGYITIHFTGLWGAYPVPIKHTVNLVQGTDPANPLFFEFRHNYNEDTKASVGYYRNSLVAFDINDILKGTGKSEFDITVKFIGFTTADKRITFHYVPGTTAHIGTSNDEATNANPYLD